MSYGELLSSQIISARFKHAGFENKWVDARKLIITNSHYEHAVVDFKLSDEKIRDYIYMRILFLTFYF